MPAGPSPGMPAGRQVNRQAEVSLKEKILTVCGNYNDEELTTLFSPRET